MIAGLVNVQRRLCFAGHHPLRATVIALAGCALLLSAVACDKVPLLAPTQSTISLFATSTIVQANGSTDIIATVIEQAGTPVQNGTVVTFTTTLGSIEPQEARTNNGRATVRFVAGSESGQATIGAVSGGATVATANLLTIKVGAAAAARIQMNASPTRVPASGGTSVITATVSDTNGNPLAAIPVTFSADVGSLSASVATTSSSGEAKVTLTTNRESKVTANAGIATTGTAAATGTITVTVNSLPALALAVTTASPVEDLPVVFTLTVTSTAASSSFQSLAVDFGDGTSQNLGAQNATTSLSHPYGSPGSYTVTATGSDATGDHVSASVIVIVGNRPPITVTISASSTSATAGTAVSFTVSVTAPTNGSVVRSVTVDYGDGSGQVTLGTSGGTVAHAFSAQGTYTVRATAIDNFGGTSTASTQVVVAGRTAVSVTIGVSATPKQGEPVTFTATVGTLPTGSSVIRYDWAFDNGSPVSTTGNAISHIYTSAGNYTVTVAVTTNDGNVGNAQVDIHVTSTNSSMAGAGPPYQSE
jgi:PKD repeat protein